jgi:hypothetical protein
MLMSSFSTTMGRFSGGSNGFWCRQTRPEPMRECIAQVSVAHAVEVGCEPTVERAPGPRERFAEREHTRVREEPRKDRIDHTHDNARTPCDDAHMNGRTERGCVTFSHPLHRHHVVLDPHERERGRERRAMCGQRLPAASRSDARLDDRCSKPATLRFVDTHAGQKRPRF